MIDVSVRPYTPQEREQLLSAMPSFIWRGRRRIARQELEDGMVEVLDLEIVRAWDMSGCRPPCCPHAYLFQVGPEEFVYAESCNAFNFPGGDFPRRRLKMVLSRSMKRVLSATPEEEPLALQDSPFDPATEYFSLPANAECGGFHLKDLSDEVRRLLEIV